MVETTPEIAELWAQVRGDSLRTGRVIEKQDAWIAAVALYLEAPLITHNGSDFAHVAGLEVITEPDP